MGKPTEPPPDSPCELPLDEGTGGGKESRYYYDADAEKCSKFKYGGSGGNTNNFESKEECEEACAPQVPDICNLPMDKGSDCEKGKGSPRYAYNAKKGKCKKFKY